VKVALAAVAALAVLAAGGAEAQQGLAPEPAYSDFAPQVSPDGTRIAFLREGVTRSGLRRAMSLYTVGIDGRHVRALTRGSAASSSNAQLGHYDAVTGLSWSPDGRRIVYTHEYVPNRYVGLRSELVVADADGNNAHTIVATEPPSFILADSPSWSSRDEIVFANFSAFWTVWPDGTGLTQVGNYDDKYQPAWSPDGSQIAYVGGQGIAVMTADGESVSVPDGGQLKESSPAWSPDGQRIAFSAEGPGPAADIFTMDLDEGHTRRLTTSAAADITPAWTPDGKSIVLASTRGRGDFEYDLWIMNADGTHQRRLIPRAVQHSWNGRRCTIVGTAATDQLDGTSKPDVLCALAGNDVIHARDHHRDFVDGGPGRDRAQIDKGLDKVSGVERILP
jgi:Tol biopolymer transport system component